MPTTNIACGPIYIGLRITIGTYVGILWQYIVRVCAKLRHKQQGAYMLPIFAALHGVRGVVLRGAARRIAQRNHKHSGELAACTASSKHMYVKIDNQAENLAGEKE